MLDEKRGERPKNDEEIILANRHRRVPAMGTLSKRPRRERRPIIIRRSSANETRANTNKKQISGARSTEELVPWGPPGGHDTTGTAEFYS